MFLNNKINKQTIKHANSPEQMWRIQKKFSDLSDININNKAFEEAKDKGTKEYSWSKTKPL